MGCLISTARDGGGNRRRPGNVGEIAVFVPGLRIPKAVDFLQSLGNCLPKSLVDRLTALRTRIVVMAGQEVPTATKSRRKTATRHGDSTLADLQLALEEYLPVLLGLVQDGNQLEHMINFCWVNQEDDSEETALPNAWYEVLSVLHLMAMLSLSQANLLLLPKTSTAGYQPKVSDECRRISIDIFLKAAGYLDCAIRNVLPKMPPELRTKLPVDLSEGVLQALCLQALGQSGDIHLGMAIDSAKATLAVKRRLACEMVKYWHQAHESIMNLRLANGWGEKHWLFVKWKYTEAKAAAYYFHGLILDEGNTEKSHGMAVAALQAAEEFLKESKKACEAFNTAPPTSRSARVRCGEELQMLIVGFGTDLALKINRSSESEPPPEYADRYPPLWGTMKYLSEKIPKDASSRERINRDLYSQEKIIQTAPALPDFAVALKPDDYILPEVDPSWNNCPKSQFEQQECKRV